MRNETRLIQGLRRPTVFSDTTSCFINTRWSISRNDFTCDILLTVSTAKPSRENDKRFSYRYLEYTELKRFSTKHVSTINRMKIVLPLREVPVAGCWVIHREAEGRNPQTEQPRARGEACPPTKSYALIVRQRVRVGKVMHARAFQTVYVTLPW